MIRSCNKCGFVVNIPDLFIKHTGYCLFFKLGNFERKDSEEKIEIKNGNEIEIAENCEGYFDVAQYFS
jgi:hypothetical protein